MVISVAELAEVFVEVADTLVDDFDVVEFVHSFTDHAVRVSGADAAGMLLADSVGHLQYLASSDEVGRVLELVQEQAEEGPCLDSYAAAAAVVNADLVSATRRWPHFAPAAIEAGFRSVHAFPMRLRERSIGALDLFVRTDDRLAPDDVRVVQSLADVATIALLQERTVATAEALNDQLQAALDSRIVIEQAKGAIAQSERITPGEAFRVLRSRARGSQRRLTVVAAEVVDGIEHPATGGESSSRG